MPLTNSANPVKLNHVLRCGLRPQVIDGQGAPTSAAAQKACLMALWALEGQKISMRKLSEIVELSDGQTKRAVRILVREGILRRHGPGGGQPSRYTINTAACVAHRAEDTPLYYPTGRKQTKDHAA